MRSRPPLDEQRLLVVRQHWIVIARALAAPALLLALALALDLMLALPGDLRLVVTLFALGVLGLWLIVTWVRWSATSLTLTEERVLLESGVFSRSTKAIPLDRLQDVSTRQSLFGRILGYGTVEIDAAGLSGNEVLDNVPAPNAVRDQVFSVSERLRRAAAN